jgi:diacylglycerol kinase (ATP)
LTYAKVIVNPAAGAGASGKKWPQVKGLLENNGVLFEHAFTEAPGHATELAMSAVGKGYELVVSVGGDGTVNEIVNGIYAAGANGDVMLGIISTGTGKDYIKTVGIPRNCEEACRRLCNPSKVIVDLGIIEYMRNGAIEKRVFVNFAGLGLDAEIVKATTNTFKALGGMPSYLIGMLSSLILHSNKDVIITMDGKPEKRRVDEVLVNNGKYGGGGMLPAPDADLSDGILDVLIINAASKPELMRSLPRIYKGTHATHPNVTMKRAKVVEVQSAQPMLVQADGELLGESPARFQTLPSALTVAV